ncbi:hypothetical protein QTP86_010149 [Hemibagrus guttatus]|nr:hypothetical protein QTP86_010149 [Hemibagrus guttatus]
MEKYRDGQRELHCVFVDLEKAYDRVPREELWYCMRKSGVAGKYVRVVQDMYERSRTVVRCAVVMDQLSEEVRQESPWTMMFADDIVICSESREQVEENLERWRFALERRGMKVSRIQSNGECGKEKISARIKGKVYRTVVRPAMLYGLETVSLRKRQESELEVAELKMLSFGEELRKEKTALSITQVFTGCGQEQHSEASFSILWKLLDKLPAEQLRPMASVSQPIRADILALFDLIAVMENVGATNVTVRGPGFQIFSLSDGVTFMAFGSNFNVRETEVAPVADLNNSLSIRELNLMKDQKLSLVELLHVCFKETKETEMSSLEKVLLIFDGLDKCRFPLDSQNTVKVSDVTESASVQVLLINLIKGNLLPSALIWITSRPAAADQIPSECVHRVTEVQGFNDPQKEKYFRKSISDQSLANNIITHLKSLRSLYIMCHIPVFCWISATVLERMLSEAESGEIPKTLTQMYTHFVIIQTNIIREKYPEKKDSNNKILLKLGQLAFQQLSKGNLIFYEEDLRQCGIDVREAAVYSGVCTQIFREGSGLQQSKVYCFVHLSVQEHLAALLYKCDLTDEGCAALTSALRSNPSHLRELNLSYNNMGDSGVKSLSAVLENPHCKLEALREASSGNEYIHMHNPYNTYAQSVHKAAGVRCWVLTGPSMFTYYFFVSTATRSLRVVPRRQKDGHTQVYDERSPDSGDKLRTSVRNDVLRNAEVPEDVDKH